MTNEERQKEAREGESRVAALPDFFELDDERRSRGHLNMAE